VVTPSGDLVFIFPCPPPVKFDLTSDGVRYRRALSGEFMCVWHERILNLTCFVSWAPDPTSDGVRCRRARSGDFDGCSDGCGTGGGGAGGFEFARYTHDAR